MSSVILCQRATWLIPAAVWGLWPALSATATAQEIQFPVSECVYCWTAAYYRALPQVTVRIKLDVMKGVSTPVADLQKRWQNGIQEKWSDKYPCSGEGPNLKFDIQWVRKDEHFTVTVNPGAGQSYITTWYEQDDGNTVAHEFGHMLGMVDEYVDPHCPHRKPVSTGTVMADIKGPVVQRYIDAVCAGAMAQVSRQVKAADDKPRKKVERITTNDLAQRPSFRLVVSGGPPGKRLQYTVTANPIERSLQYTFLDELKNPETRKGEGELGGETAEKLLLPIRQEALPPSLFGGPFLPGSMVASLTIETAEKQQVFLYGLEGRPQGELPVFEPRSLPKADEPQRAAIASLHQILTGELLTALRAK
jgi:hypothetical protein